MCVKTLGFAQTHKGMIPLTSLIKLPLPPQLIEGNFFRQEASKGNSTVDLCYSPVHRLYVLSLRQDRIFRYHSLRSFLMLRTPGVSRVCIARCAAVMRRSSAYATTLTQQRNNKTYGKDKTLC